MSENVNSIFDLKEENFVIAGEHGSSGEFQRDPDLYQVGLTGELAKKNKKYSSIIRFLPNPKDPVGGNIIGKYIYFLPDPKNPNARIQVDCPSNAGNNNNIMSVAKMTLNKLTNPIYKAVGRHFTRRFYYWALVQVIKDEHQPELEGKILIMRFSKQIKEKIDHQLEENLSIGKKSCIVQDVFKGKNFALIMQEKPTDTGNITSYESSYFLDDRSGISINGEVLEDPTPENKKKILDYLSTAPDLDKVKYQPWTPQQEEQYIEIVKSLIDDPKLFNSIYQQAYGKPYFSNSTGVATTTTEDYNLESDAENIEVEEMSFDSVAESSMQSVVTETSTSDSDFSDISLDDLDDL